MNSHSQESVLEHGGAALKILDRLVSEKPHDTHQGMSDVVRHLVRCRNHLISEWRSENQRQPGTKDRLDAINAILSVAVGAQHPIVGIKPKRIVLARDALRALLDEAGPSA